MKVKHVCDLCQDQIPEQRGECVNAREAHDSPDNVSNAARRLDVVRTFIRAETTLHRLAERECNGDDWRNEKGPRHLLLKGNPAGQKTVCGESLTTVDNIPAKMLTIFRKSAVTCSSCKGAPIEARIRRLAERWGLSVRFNGDPRGSAILLAVPSGFTNDWGKRGVCVP